MFEITSDDIAKLDDENLREVIARLCEAEVRSRGYSSSYVTWGGNQNASDEGVDVRVSLPAGSVIEGFVPRVSSGFQVKRQDMPASKIVNEMRPEGIIRDSIRELADQNGAYVIVSSQGSTADSSLRRRRKAMREAVAEIYNSDRLTLDFYDRTRVATWVRSHHGIIPFVRHLVGRDIPGWQSYGSWAYAPAPASEGYILDEQLRIHSAKRETQAGVSALRGIELMRDELRQARRIVRLVGLSGVGKTRLVQALFDERIGGSSLDPSLAIYTNMSDAPDPSPIGFVSALVAEGRRSILVIDNCAPELHQRLSELCRQPNSEVSVITVEYDIRDDQTEGTEVFALGSSSEKLIEQLLRRRFPQVSQTDVCTIAEFSGGNARIAIALAATIELNETVAGLTDEQLFRRLFLQRHTHDESLYLAAQVCALVYSFQGEDVSDGEKAELVRLGNLVDMSPQQIYRLIAELQRRGLVQKRGPWRAVLPHAIANRLAAAALQNLPYAEIEKHLVERSPPRLLKSLSRRLGYLHASQEAFAIAKLWLEKGGLLDSSAIDGSDLFRAMFRDIAPIAPEVALTTLELAVLRPQGEQWVTGDREWLDLVRSFAYDAALFPRCVELLIKMLTSDDATKKTHRVQVFASLFQLLYSGTHAAIELRAKIAASLLSSTEAKRRSLGVIALKALLEAWHFTPAGSFDFGARSRDYGYWPRSAEDARRWFAVSLKLARSFASGGTMVAPQARAAVAEKFTGLWVQAGAHEEITDVCLAIRDIEFWPEGWLAVREALALHGNGLAKESLAKLIALEVELRPVDLVHKVRAVVFSARLYGFDLDDYTDCGAEESAARYERVEILSQELGRTVASHEPAFVELLPEIVTNDGRLWSFGRGLVEGGPNAEETWRRLTTAFASADENLRKPAVLCGYVHQLRTEDSALLCKLLDEAVQDRSLAPYYPLLQVSAGIEAEGVARLRRSVALRIGPAHMYRCLSGGGATDLIPAGDFKELLLSIAGLPYGFSVAAEILYMRLFSERNSNQAIPPELSQAGCELLELWTFEDSTDMQDLWLGDIAKSCLIGEHCAPVTARICRRFKAAVAAYDISAFYHDSFLDGLFAAQPKVALESLCGGDEEELAQGFQILLDVDKRKHLLAALSDEDVLSWCDEAPENRYSALARVIAISGPSASDEQPRWTTIALRFLEKAPRPGEVLSLFVSRFMPSGWSGSLAAILEVNARLLDQLEPYTELSAVVAQQKKQLQGWIDIERRREKAFDRELDERFE